MSLSRGVTPSSRRFAATRGSASAGRSGRGRTAASTTPSLSRSRQGRRSDTRVRVPAGTRAPCCPQASQAGLSRFVLSHTGAPECPPPRCRSSAGHGWVCPPPRSLQLWVIPGAVSPCPRIPSPLRCVPMAGFASLPGPHSTGTALGLCPGVPLSPPHRHVPCGWVCPLPESLWHWGIPGAMSPCPHVPFPLTCDPVPSSLSPLSQVPVAPISLSAPSRGPCWWLPSS